MIWTMEHVSAERAGGDTNVMRNVGLKTVKDVREMLKCAQSARMVTGVRYANPAQKTVREIGVTHKVESVYHANQASIVTHATGNAQVSVKTCVSNTTKPLIASMTMVNACVTFVKKVDMVPIAAQRIVCMLSVMIAEINVMHVRLVGMVINVIRSALLGVWIEMRGAVNRMEHASVRLVTMATNVNYMKSKTERVSNLLLEHIPTFNVQTA